MRRILFVVASCAIATSITAHPNKPLQSRIDERPHAIRMFFGECRQFVAGNRVADQHRAADIEDAYEAYFSKYLAKIEKQPNLQILVLNQTMHHLYLEKPAEVEQAIRQFFAAQG